MNLFFKVFFKLERGLEKKRIEMLKKSLKYCGGDVDIHPLCRIIVPEKMEIGDATSIAHNTVIFAAFGVKIGKNCMISSNCGISSYNHIQNSANRRQDQKNDFKYSKPVIIGDNVWIGMNACILPGVTIGNNSIIGSGSVITKDVPCNEVWAGNPAKFIKKLDIGSQNTESV